MQLFYARPSPYVRKVMVMLHELGKTGDISLIDAAPSPVKPDGGVLKANPLGKIPCLITDGGAALYDSRVITRYLDDHYGGGFYGEGAALWSALALEALADGLLDAALLCVYETREREEAERSAAWREGQKGKITRALDDLEANAMDRLEGPFGMPAIAVGCALGYLDFRREMGGWADWREGRPRLAAWGEAFMKRPSMSATAPG